MHSFRFGVATRLGELGLAVAKPGPPAPCQRRRASGWAPSEVDPLRSVPAGRPPSAGGGASGLSPSRTARGGGCSGPLACGGGADGRPPSALRGRLLTPPPHSPHSEPVSHPLSRMGTTAGSTQVARVPITTHVTRHPKKKKKKERGRGTPSGVSRTCMLHRTFHSSPLHKHSWTYGTSIPLRPVVSPPGALARTPPPPPPGGACTQAPAVHTADRPTERPATSSGRAVRARRANAPIRLGPPRPSDIY
jgi:hypothetical protein